MFTKKSILKYSVIFIVILCSAFACEDEGYSLSDFRINIATVIPDGQQSYYLILDNGEKLLPASTDVFYSPRENQRVFVNYTLLSDNNNGYDHQIKVNDIWNILTKPVISLTDQEADNIGNDPIQINEFWIGDDYLNASFSFNYGHVKPHAINLIQNEIVNSQYNEVLELEFRHNSYNSQYNSLFDGFVCFDLKPFRKENRDSIPVIIKYRNWDGDQTYELTYRYNNLNKDGQLRSIPNVSSNEYK